MEGIHSIKITTEMIPLLVDLSGPSEDEVPGGRSGRGYQSDIERLNTLGLPDGPELNRAIKVLKFYLHYSSRPSTVQELAQVVNSR